VSSHLSSLRRRWPVALLAATATLAVLVPVTLGLPNLYRSSASLLVNQLPDPSFLQTGSAWEVDDHLQAIKQEALSRTRLTQLADQFDLYPALRAQGAVADVIDRFQKDVKVEITSTTARNNRVATVAFKVTYVGTNPSTVASVANRIASFYVEKNDEMRSGQVSRTAAFLKQELDSTKSHLDRSEQNLIGFTTTNAGALPQQISSTLAKYGQATQQLQLNTADQLRLMERRDSVQTEIANLSAADASVDVADPALKLAQAQRELDELKIRFGDSMPEVRDKKNEIAALRTAVTAAKVPHDGAVATTPSRLAVLHSQLAGITARLDEIKKNSDDVQRTIHEYDALIERAPVRDAEFEKISRDVQWTRDRYDALQKRYQDALLAERAEQRQRAEEFHILDSAEPARDPAVPDRRLLLGGSVVIALAAGVGIVMLLGLLDTSFGSVDDLRAYTRVPVLATIPIIATRRETWRRVLTSSAIGTFSAIGLTAVGVGVFHVARHAEGITRILLRFV
jgi:polysaccharide chain length determinant protein (PEP-CTERM system associated)